GKLLGGVLAAFVVATAVGILSIHNQWTDRINPLLPEQTSYAKVPQGTQRYRNVELYTVRREKPTMVLKEMTGYDPKGQYVAVQHKGQYVKRVSYVSKEAFVERMP
ncbi:YxeA family protein, partial [Lacticaseibacillus chiayiensis]|uniref:YxeA family protein n=1 Tax=Lacticaseibacillus chiayiensis TaxID=2100821 RepID=UPI0010130F14